MRPSADTAVAARLDAAARPRAEAYTVFPPAITGAVERHPATAHMTDAPYASAIVDGEGSPSSSRVRRGRTYR